MCVCQQREANYEARLRQQESKVKFMETVSTQSRQESMGLRAQVDRMTTALQDEMRKLAKSQNELSVSKVEAERLKSKMARARMELA